MRFIQIWIMPERLGLDARRRAEGVHQADRTDRLLKAISGDGGDAVSVHQDAHVFVSRLTPGSSVSHELARAEACTST